MLKSRLIPCLLLQNGFLVRSERFKTHQVIGYPLEEVRRFNEWTVDELLYLDISVGDHFDVGRDDHKVHQLDGPLAVLDAAAAGCFIPLTFGGRVRSVEDMAVRFHHGADKVAINSAAVRTPELITEGARRFGSQAIVVAVDVKIDDAGSYEVVVDCARGATGLDPIRWAKEAERLGAGEILLQSVDRDGTGEGYDIELIRAVADAVTIPVIALGGAGRYEDFARPIIDGHASAVAAANIFHFKELSDRNGKRAMRKAGVDVRL